MGTLTIRLPDDKHERLKALASHKKVSVNKLMEELSTQAVAEFDSEVRFRSIASKTSRPMSIKPCNVSLPKQIPNGVI